MKQRILVAVVGIPALLAVLCIAPAWATALLLAALTVIAAHELLTAVSGPDKARRWTVLPALCGVLLLARAVWPGCAALEGLLLAAALTLPLSGVLTYGKPHALTFTDVCAMAAAGFAIPWAFSGLYGLRMLENGYLLVLTPLVAAFCSDALALFTGMALGRHKLAPLVSPHKTVEGAAGRSGGRHGRHGHFLPGVPGHHRRGPGPAPVRGPGPAGRGAGGAGGSELLRREAPVRHQGLRPSAAGPRRRAGPVRQRAVCRPGAVRPAAGLGGVNGIRRIAT
ncbi:MAG: phosphatidate cytidylyltransferase [Oscillospiraceae bacterium]